ncbi:50S ribosomal protein L6, partial [Burkholderia cepacia]
MSRIGKAPITVPNGVDVTVASGANPVVTVKGPKGTLSFSVPGAITVSKEDGTL